MALDILHDNWGPYTHTEVENALKAYLAGLEDRINQAIQSGGVGLADLSAEVQALLNKANTALQPENIAAWAKAQNKPGYTVSEITGVEGFQNLLAKLQDMDAKIQAAGQSGGVDPDDEMSSTSEKPVQNKVIKAYVDGLIQGLQNVLNTITQDGATQGVIDTFNEVKAFLNGINTSDPTLYNTLQTLNTRINNLQTALAGKQDTLTFDNAPTAGSNNPVKSGGIKTAIDQVTPTINENGKWVIGGVATDKDAQGPRGNSVLVNEDSTAIQGIIVNNLVDGGETDILSAEMGKVIRQNIMRIFNALGTYAFPDGKPILNWGSTVINHSINVNGVTGGLTIDDVEIDGVSAASLPAQIVEGKSLSLRLVLPSNLYVFNDGVSITMGGVNITNNTGVWDESTGEINIAAVTDDIVISANAITYASSGLAFHLDCKNRGGELNKWIDLIGGKEFILSQVNASDAGVEFDGANSTAICNSSLAIPFNSGTIEFVMSPKNSVTNGDTILYNGYDGGIGAAYWDYNNSKGLVKKFSSASTDTSAFLQCTEEAAAVSISNTRAYVNGVDTSASLSMVSTKWNINPNSSGKLLIATRVDASNNYYYNQLTIKAIRVYNTILSADDALKNYKVDKKRFNLS